MGFKQTGLSKYIQYVFFILWSVQDIVIFIFRFMGVYDPVESRHHHHEKQSESTPFSPVLTREFLVVKNFKDIHRKDLPESCAVCLDHFEGDDKITCLKNCTHIFHQGCLDSWMDRLQGTCPMCRKPILPLECQDEYQIQLKVAADHHYLFEEFLGIPDL